MSTQILLFWRAGSRALRAQLRGQYPEAWGRYGFVTSFNPLTGWYDSDVVGINTGIVALMAENQRTSFVWQTFMKNPEVRNAMSLAGFQDT
ncbi:MAG: glucoamylase family protein [Candidatus Acidiferrales bacterium]